MKTINQTKAFMICFMFILGLIIASPISAQEYVALEDVEAVDTVFDVRSADPQSVMEHLQLVHMTYTDPAIQEISENPNFVVVFMGPSVTLLSSDREDFSEEEREVLERMDRQITAMADDGIVLEVCMVAADYFDVDPETIAPEIYRVENGWISSIGYQSKGYALIPVY